MVDMVALNASDRIEDDLHLRSCIQCGDCSGVCPLGFLMDFPPSKIIAEIRSETYARVIRTNSAWMCIACSACTTVCPMQIPVTINVMSRAKEELVLAGNVPPELQAALENSQRYGNPGGKAHANAPTGSKALTRPSQFLEEKNALPTCCGSSAIMPHSTHACSLSSFGYRGHQSTSN